MTSMTCSAAAVGTAPQRRCSAAFGPRGRALVARRRALAPCRASVEAEQLLAGGRAKYDGGDRMGALRLWERALEQGPTREQRLAALFNAACVHASFGDLELAQIPLKDAIYGGLDFQQAMSGADPTYVRLKASAQVLIQLRKFNEQVLKAKAGGGAAAPPKYASSASGAAAGGGSRASGKGVLGRDMSDVLSTDAESIDASIGGIIKRVVVLLLALSGLGVALWFGGMKYMMVD